MIGEHCIINAACVIDHDVEIEVFVNNYPNSYMGGEAKITSYKTVEPNTVIPRQSIF